VKDPFLRFMLQGSPSATHLEELRDIPKSLIHLIPTINVICVTFNR